MPSQPVLEALEDLHRNLNKMKPAIEQVKITEKLAEEVNKIPGVHKTFIADIQKLEREFHSLLKKEFQENAVTITGSVDKVVDSAQQTIASLSDHNEQILKLRNNIQSYYSKLDGMQIPYRLDTLQKSSEEKLTKLDSSTISMQSALISLQGRLDFVERNIKDSLKDESEKQLRHIQSLKENITSQLDKVTATLTDVQQQQKRQEMHTMITWLIVAVCAALILYFKK